MCNRKYCRIYLHKYILRTIILALNECEKQGDFCPRLSTCEKNDDGSHRCVCKSGFRMAGKEENRTCEGTNDVFKVWNWNVLNDTLIQGLKSLRSWRCCLREAKAKSN